MRKQLNNWKPKKYAFEPDGALRDIYIYESSRELWDQLIKLLSESDIPQEFWHGDVKLILPSSFTEIEKLQETNPTTLKIFLQKSIQINCHFFIDEEIEMDLDPKKINDQKAFETLISFLERLAINLKRNVHVTMENSPEFKLLSIEYKNA